MKIEFKRILLNCQRNYTGRYSENNENVEDIASEYVSYCDTCASLKACRDAYCGFGRACPERNNRKTDYYLRYSESVGNSRRAVNEEICPLDEENKPDDEK